MKPSLETPETGAFELFSVELQRTNLRNISILDLYRGFAIGSLVVITGSGTTQLVGYPTWTNFASKLAKKAIEVHGATNIDPLTSVASGERSFSDPLPVLTLAAQILRSEASTADPRRTALAEAYRELFAPRKPTAFVPRHYSNSEFGIDENQIIPGDLTEVARLFGDVEDIPPQNDRQKLNNPRPTIDPLATLKATWNINRFITYNYNLEIEQMLEHFDFPVGSLTDNNTTTARTRLGIPGKSLDITPKNASELFALASNYPRNAYHVLHLHGSVKKPDEMIVTDSDYNDRYANPAQRELWEDSLNLLFQGNALVFVGIGMKEDDLLRPLRMLTAARTSSRPVFAFMPSLVSANDDTLTETRIFHRYGVRAIFYGTKLDPDAESQYGSFARHPLAIDAQKLHAGIKPDELSPLHDELKILNSIIRIFEKKAQPDDAKFLKDLREMIGLGTLSIKSGSVVAAPRRLVELCPRLILTRHFSAGFVEIISRDPTLVATAEQEHILAALGQLKDAITSRALNDALLFFSDRAMEWRSRFDHQPQMRAVSDSRVRHVVKWGAWSTQHRAEVLKLLDERRILIMPEGSGKGTLATTLGSIAEAEKGLVISFANSCEYDSAFDRIRLALSKPERFNFIALIHVDKVFSEKSGLPKLYEWHKAMMELITSDKILLIVCKHVRTGEYFRFLPRDGQPEFTVGSYKIGVGWFSCFAGAARALLGTQFELSDVDRKQEYVGQIFPSDLKTAQETKMLLELIESALLRERPRADGPRLTKVIYHVILRNLFAFSVPVTSRTLSLCPEITRLWRQFHVDERESRKLLQAALRRLESLHLIFDLKGGNGVSRYIVHSVVRKLLAREAGLPFSYVRGREQCALTVLACLDEEHVALSPDDVTFVIETFDKLVDSGSPEAVRAAFGLLRGNLRIGVVLRCTPGSMDDSGRSISLLDRYFLCLLKLRRAAFQQCRPEPMALYEREWIWLMNELGVVRLLQGNLHDAITLLESASRLEGQRLGLKSGGESTSLLRIKLNLAEAYIERGSFTRVASLIGYVDAYLEAERVSAVSHSELRILKVVSLLIRARSSYLQSQLKLASEALVEFENSGGHQVGIFGISSIFYRIQADIKVAEGSNTDSAVEKSIAAARSSGRVDLELRAELGGVAARRDSSKERSVRESLKEMQSIERRLSAVGLLGILCSLKIIRAELKVQIGATRSAKDELIGALQLTTRYGMRLKRVRCLSEMGQLMLDSAEDDDARNEGFQLASLAKTEAEKIGYRVFLDSRD